LYILPYRLSLKYYVTVLCVTEGLVQGTMALQIIKVKYRGRMYKLNTNRILWL
jgi:hypothetical protein